MPSVSKSQQALMGMAYSVATGEKQLSEMPEGARDSIKKIVDSMTEDQIKDFASTATEDLPGAVKEALSTINERDYSQEERDNMAKTGEAMADGSFPIKDKEDLENAVKLVHMSDHPDKAKEHVKKRAKALGATDSLPADWVGENKQKVPNRLRLMSSILTEALEPHLEFTEDLVIQTAQKGDIDVTKYDKSELAKGMDIEMEHGTVNPITDVTHDDLVATMKIAMVHLDENPNYYTELAASGIDESGGGGGAAGGAAATGAATLGSVNGVGGWTPGIQSQQREAEDKELKFLYKNKKMSTPDGIMPSFDEFKKSMTEAKLKKTNEATDNDYVNLWNEYMKLVNIADGLMSEVGDLPKSYWKSNVQKDMDALTSGSITPEYIKGKEKEIKKNAKELIDGFNGYFGSMDPKSAKKYGSFGGIKTKMFEDSINTNEATDNGVVLKYPTIHSDKREYEAIQSYLTKHFKSGENYDIDADGNLKITKETLDSDFNLKHSVEKLKGKEAKN